MLKSYVIQKCAAETLGFTSFPPAYLSPQASGKNLLIGANFASAGSGYYDHTSIMSVSIRNRLACYTFENLLIAEVGC